jgi:hypothetical protein
MLYTEDFRFSPKIYHIKALLFIPQPPYVGGIPSPRSRPIVGYLGYGKGYDISSLELKSCERYR